MKFQMKLSYVLNTLGHRLKGLIHPNMNNLSFITRFIQTRTTFVHPQNTNEDIFDETQELSGPL